MTREEHLSWAKERALAYVDAGDLQNALTSLISDLNKHHATSGHPGIALGIRLSMAHHLQTAQQMRDWIEGFQ